MYLCSIAEVLEYCFVVSKSLAVILKLGTVVEENFGKWAFVNEKLVPAQVYCVSVS